MSGCIVEGCLGSNRKVPLFPFPKNQKILKVNKKIIFNLNKIKIYMN